MNEIAEIEIFQLVGNNLLQRAVPAYRTAYDCNTDKLSILGTADGKLMPRSCLMAPVMRIDKCVRCCKGNGRERQHGITPVNAH